MKADRADKPITFTGQRLETVTYRKESGKTGAVLFETKAGKWKTFSKVQTHDLPFHVICHNMMKLTDSPNC